MHRWWQKRLSIDPVAAKKRAIHQYFVCIEVSLLLLWFIVVGLWHEM
jgi:hypothetical protein